MNTLVLGQGLVVNLHTSRALWRVPRLNLVDTQDSTGRSIESVMIELEVTKSRVEA